MAFSVGGNTASRRRGSRTSVGELSEINIIPLVDVVLVLLIIFMLTAHVMEYGMEVDVPKVASNRSASTQNIPIVTFSSSGRMQLNEREINVNQLGAELKKRFPKDKAVFVRADRKVTWDGLAQVISALGAAKYDVKLVTQAADDVSRRR